MLHKLDQQLLYFYDFTRHWKNIFQNLHHISVVTKAIVITGLEQTSALLIHKRYCSLVLSHRYIKQHYAHNPVLSNHNIATCNLSSGDEAALGQQAPVRQLVHELITQILWKIHFAQHEQ